MLTSVLHVYLQLILVSVNIPVFRDSLDKSLTFGVTGAQSPPLDTTVFKPGHRQQQTRPPFTGARRKISRVLLLFFSPPTFLKFRFRVLFWRHSQTQLIGSLGDQIRALPVPISSIHKHPRHRSQRQREAADGLPAAGSPDRRWPGACRAAFKYSSWGSYR